MKAKYDIRIPDEVLFIIGKLNSTGYKAYIVGGCVRDGIMGRVPQDWDICTSSLPDETMSIFDKAIDTGAKHGTVTVVVNGKGYEVTTFRLDGVYRDNRRPERVDFTSSIEEDLGRRDFTINAMAYHPVEGFIDPYKGTCDIKKKLIRAVGNPEKRFLEDALRMLRAVRFSAQLDFSIDPATFQSIKSCCRLITNISYERIRDELTKILVSSNPMNFSLLKETGLLHHILPEFELCYDIRQNHPYHLFNVALHSLYSVSNIENVPVLRWAMLLHDLGKSRTKTTDEKNIDHFYGHPQVSTGMAKDILNRLRFDNKNSELICRLIRFHDRSIETNHKAVRRALNVIGEDIFEYLLKVKEADKKAQNPEYLEEGLSYLNVIKSIYLDIKQKQQCTSLKDLAVDGKDLINLGLRQGKEIGEVLQKLLKSVIENPELNEKEKLLELARRIPGKRRG